MAGAACLRKQTLQTDRRLSASRTAPFLLNQAWNYGFCASTGRMRFIGTTKVSSSVCPLDHVLTSKHRRPESMTHLKHRVRQRSLDHLCPPSSTYSLSLLSSLFAVPPSWEAKSFLNKTFLFGCVHASSVPAERLSRCAFPRQAQVKRPDSINLRVKGSDVFGASSENGHDTRSLLATDLKTWRQPPLLTCGGLRDDSVDLLTAGLRYSGLPPCSARSRRTTFQPGRGNRRRSRHSDLSRNLTEPNRWQLSLERVAVAVGVVSSSQQSVPAVVFARRRGGSLIRGENSPPVVPCRTQEIYERKVCNYTSPQKETQFQMLRRHANAGPALGSLASQSSWKRPTFNPPSPSPSAALRESGEKITGF